MLLLMLRYVITCVYKHNIMSIIQYTVTGRGYTFTRHNNKFTMNINSDVFFDDKPAVSTSHDQTAPISMNKREATLSPTQNSQKQRSAVYLFLRYVIVPYHDFSLKASNNALQKKLEER